jgi:hypothetical protein
VKPLSVSKILGYGVSFLTLVVGGIVLFGFFLPPTIPEQFRITCGVVLVLMGVYRFVVTRAKVDEAMRGSS